MSKVTRLNPQLNLSNIPHMLRNLADEYEQGLEEMPRAVLLIAIGDDEMPPQVFSYGEELPRLMELGALEAAKAFLNQTEVE
jgi:hypothetical protein